ncbi:uncharacterized protein [Gossypium hirsutum]|uniref:Uncharacterized protein isoform X3 n=1 Tax=Gossypium hirsutum TaxID=3635 RepID=A0ABM3BL57_GOSHI|nr:uncharacterized protein LOC107934887 isoform X3 [Gossypium hirsutum]
MKMISFFVTDARKNSKTHYTVIFSAVSVFGIFDSLASSAPVHQLQQYYREGVLDNCYGKWSALWDCLYLKTKPSSQLQLKADWRMVEDELSTIINVMSLSI